MGRQSDFKLAYKALKVADRLRREGGEGRVADLLATLAERLQDLQQNAIDAGRSQSSVDASINADWRKVFRLTEHGDVLAIRGIAARRVAFPQGGVDNVIGDELEHLAHDVMERQGS
jgi:hypothetical protein